MVQVSLVATFYNKERFVPGVVRSLARQEGLESAELILVDDGSTDGTADALAKAVAGLSNARIVRQENGGPSAAINTGIAQAAGTWVKFLDGDDALRPGAARAMIETAERLGCDVAFGGLAGYGGTDPFAAMAALDAFDAGRRHDRPLEKLIRHWQINPSQLLARRVALDRVGGADARVFIQDFSLALRLAAQGPFAEIDTPVALFPDAVDERMTANSAQILHDLNLATVLFLNDSPDVADAVRRAFLNRVWERAYKWAARHGSTPGAAAVLARRTAFRLGFGGIEGPRLLDATRPFAETDHVRLTEAGAAALAAAGVRHRARADA